MGPRSTSCGPAISTWSPPVPTTGARPVQVDGTSTDPAIRGLARLDLLEDAAILKVRVSNTTPAEGDFEIQLAIDGDAFGATSVTVRLGEWVRVVLSTDGSGVGKAPSHVEMLWPVGASGIALNDEWEIPIRVESPWVTSLPPVRGLSEVETDLYLDGVRVVAPGLLAQPRRHPHR